MKFVRREDAVLGSNSGKCGMSSYYFGDKDVDLCLATIRGRYPETGFCVNLICKELVYVLEGSGSLCFEDEVMDFKQDDAVLIENGRKYYWSANYCKVAISSCPALTTEQCKIVV